MAMQSGVRRPVRAGRLVWAFMRASLQEALAYRANFLTGVLNALLTLATGLLGVAVIFGQVEELNGWSFAGTLVVLGVYLIVGALRDLFMGPSLDALAGMDGEVWTGKLDFTLLRPVDTQFIASLSRWRPFALFDLLLGTAVLVTATVRLGTGVHWLSFLPAIGAAVLTLYAILLAFAGLVFWSPGFLFTWVFDGLFQMARYPVGLYPGGLRLVLTWIIPVGVITTFPAEALAGRLPVGLLWGAVGFAIGLAVAASWLFRAGLRRYASASS